MKFLDSMIILLQKNRFRENFMENSVFYVFRYQLIIYEVLLNDVTRKI